MARGRGVAPVLIAVGLALSPLVSVVAELRRLASSPLAPEAAELPFEEGAAAASSEFTAPGGAERGRFVPARVVNFHSPSPFASTYYIRFLPGDTEVIQGSAVMTR